MENSFACVCVGHGKKLRAVVYRLGRGWVGGEGVCDWVCVCVCFVYADGVKGIRSSHFVCACACVCVCVSVFKEMSLLGSVRQVGLRGVGSSCHCLALVLHSALVETCR